MRGVSSYLFSLEKEVETWDEWRRFLAAVSAGRTRLLKWLAGINLVLYLPSTAIELLFFFLSQTELCSSKGLNKTGNLKGKTLQVKVFMGWIKRFLSERLEEFHLALSAMQRFSFSIWALEIFNSGRWYVVTKRVGAVRCIRINMDDVRLHSNCLYNSEWIFGISRRQSQTTNVEQTTWTFGQLEKIGETKDFDRQLVKRN